ncbi:hypothetical protein CAMSH0001_0492 [Campylobacter showae RM3277]|uniref:Uncharacterized protein n=1 Tax=Campylobacter showae RM3277 TaxID=553219 RepID=C6RFI7_9BACT|nr:hypothetical protein CAMSH0001_0492 [Campylobacter showae RM3277]
MVAIPKNIKKQTTTTKTDSLKMARPFKFSKFKFAGELNLGRIYQNLTPFSLRPL